ncbi:hypothetical protein [Candidatus Poriferisodalis sp.]|uniref:hypothetical protein n=1 Tax=Candidatus Poriferisodalis sp. TaxID=3101277 RepID=UPI003B019303
MAFITSDTEPTYATLCAHLESVRHRLLQIGDSILSPGGPPIDDPEIMELINTHANVAAAVLAYGQALYGDSSVD